MVYEIKKKTTNTQCLKNLATFFSCQISMDLSQKKEY